MIAMLHAFIVTRVHGQMSRIKSTTRTSSSLRLVWASAAQVNPWRSSSSKRTKMIKLIFSMTEAYKTSSLLYAEVSHKKV